MGVINAAQNIGMKKPIIIRLKGTNVEEAKKLIEVRFFMTDIHTHIYIFVCGCNEYRHQDLK
jgi:succinyl-CoA synthetase beta subunit